MTNVSRRTVLQSSLLVGAGTAATALTTTPANAAPGFLNADRGALTHGIASGDVTHNSAVVWSRANTFGTLGVRYRIPGTPDVRTQYTPVHAHSDFTGKINLTNLNPGETYEYEMFHLSPTGCRSAGIGGTFNTAPISASKDVSFVWTGDTAGQGWGRQVDVGMPAYLTMLNTNPDFFIHCGDTVYADGPMKASVELPDGRTYRNVISDGVEKVAESQAEFWGRHRYNVGDQHVQAMNARVPVIAQWDDHETVNNWYPGEILQDDRYQNENRVDVLAKRARKAFVDYFPLDTRTRDHFGNVYGKFSRGPLMDVFVIDMRTYRAPNSPNTQPVESDATVFLGKRQMDWLIRELKASTATWKVIASDMPIGLVVGDGDHFEAVANADNGKPLGRELEIARLLKNTKDVKNVVWFTADVHYCAAHEYSPETASFTEFTPFWEFVGGPINAGTFGPNKLDGTFGPVVHYQETGHRVNGSPMEGGQFFGHAHVAADTGVLTVKLINGAGETRYTKTLDPQR